MDGRYFTSSKPDWPLRAIAQAYGLTADDLAHILAAFPVFARNGVEFHAFLQARLSEWVAREA